MVEKNMGGEEKEAVGRRADLYISKTWVCYVVAVVSIVGVATVV